MRDIFELCARGITNREECWMLWKRKNPGRDEREGPEKVLFYIERLEQQRPLDKMQSQEERDRAASLRSWFRSVFCPTAAP